MVVVMVIMVDKVPVVLMHMRGDPASMNSLCDYGEDVVGGVADELLQQLRKADDAGIPRLFAPYLPYSPP